MLPTTSRHPFPRPLPRAPQRLSGELDGVWRMQSLREPAAKRDIWKRKVEQVGAAAHPAGSVNACPPPTTTHLIGMLHDPSIVHLHLPTPIPIHQPLPTQL